MENDYTDQKQELLYDIATDITYVDAYLRYSSKNQDDGVSIEMQTDDINAYCARNNMVVRKWYIDTATSASKKASETRSAFYDYSGYKYRSISKESNCVCDKPGLSECIREPQIQTVPARSWRE